MPGTRFTHLPYAFSKSKLQSSLLSFLICHLSHPFITSCFHLKSYANPLFPFHTNPSPHSSPPHLCLHHFNLVFRPAPLAVSGRGHIFSFQAPLLPSKYILRFILVLNHQIFSFLRHVKIGNCKMSSTSHPPFQQSLYYPNAQTHTSLTSISPILSATATFPQPLYIIVTTDTTPPPRDSCALCFLIPPISPCIILSSLS